MTVRRPLVRAGGRLQQLPPGDTLPANSMRLLLADGSIARVPLDDNGEMLVKLADGSEARVPVNVPLLPQDAVLVAAQQLVAHVAATDPHAQYALESALGTAAVKDAPASGDATATQVVLGSDTRLSDARAPTAHTHADATASVAGFMSAADKGKLDGVAAGATANATNAQLRDRSTHTGEQAISTVTGLQAALDAKAPLYGPVVTKSATSQTSLLSDAGGYLRFTNAAASTYTVAPQASVAWAADTEITIRRAAGTNLTLVAGSGVTLTAPSGGTLVLTNAMTVTLKRAASNVWDVIGQTVPA